MHQHSSTLKSLNLETLSLKTSDEQMLSDSERHLRHHKRAGLASMWSCTRLSKCQVMTFSLLRVFVCGLQISPVYVDRLGSAAQVAIPSDQRLCAVLQAASSFVV